MTSATDCADADRCVEEVNALNNVVEDTSEQVEAIRTNATRMMANMQTFFCSGPSA